MKKLQVWLCIAVFFLCSSMKGYAQLGEERHNLAIGINGGINLNQVSFSPRIKQNMYKAPVMGFTARYITEKYFSMICGLQMEVNLAQKGWEERIEDGSNDTYSRTMTYLEVPFMAHLAFGKDHLRKGVRFFINMGPEISYFLNEKENFSATWDPTYRPNGVKEQYGKATENRFDYGIVAGAGIEISTPIGHFLVDGRYHLGLNDFFKNTKKDYFSRSAHNDISVKLTYLFDIVKH